jgi:secreted PhoX family phosphatase
VSVVEVRKTNGTWDLVPVHRLQPPHHAGTPMEIRGPVRGSDLVKTKYSPNGTMARGTINNCAHGYTPWGTYLTCEENWAGYFKNDVQASAHRRAVHALGFNGTTTRQGDYTPASTPPGTRSSASSTRRSTRRTRATSTRSPATR